MSGAADLADFVGCAQCFAPLDVQCRDFCGNKARRKAELDLKSALDLLQESCAAFQGRISVPPVDFALRLVEFLEQHGRTVS